MALSPLSIRRSFLVCFIIATCLSHYALSDGEITVDNKDSLSKPCPFVYGSRISSAQDGLMNCTWYSSNACCKRTEVTSVFSGMLPLATPDTMEKALAKKCRNMVNYMMCYFCDPNQEQWYTTKLHICEDFCDEAYVSCSQAAVDGVSIGSKFSSGKHFCESQNFKIVPGTSGCFKFDPTVFDDSSRVMPALLVGALLNFLLLVI